jgi:N-dimethylarginine dimethylaminohydrolase
MERYLIETPHTAHDCQMLVDEVYAMGYLNHFDWGCPDGVHSGWAIIEAENEAQARLAVPSLVRNKARVIRLTKFTGDPESYHETHKQIG